MTAPLVDVCALLVHHVIELKQTLTYAEVVFFHTFLGLLNGVAYHFRLNHIAFLVAHAVEHLDYRVGGEEAHQLVFERNKEYRRTRVPLTA